MIKTTKIYSTLEEFMKTHSFFEDETEYQFWQRIWDSAFKAGASHQYKLDQEASNWDNFKDAGY